MTAPTMPARSRVATAADLARRTGARLRDRMSALSAPAWVVAAVAGVVAALTGLVLGVLPLLLLWMTTPASGLDGAQSIRAGGLLWLAAQGTPVSIGVTTISLLPWGLVVGPLVLLGIAGASSARACALRGWRDVGVIVAAGAPAYAVVAAVVSRLVSGDAAGVSTVDALLHALAVGAVGLGWGAARGAGVGLGALPAWLAATTRSAVVALMTLLGISAVVLTIALALRIDDAITMARALDAGFGGGLSLLLLGIGYVPVLVVWTAGYLLGGGVAIGADTTLSPFLATPVAADLPPFPLFAALPSTTTPMAWALPLAAVAAGIVGGALLGRVQRAEPRLFRLTLALAASALAALALGALAHVASGALGSDRLAWLGPPPLTTAVLAAVLIGFGLVPAAIAPGARGRVASAVPSAARSDHRVPPDEGTPEEGSDV